MEDFERRRYFETLAATPQALKAAIKGLPKKLLLWTPAPGKWSILEILCHLRDMEREGYLERYTRILSEDEPRLPDLNGDALAITRAYRSQRAPEVVRDWVALRRQTLQLLRKAGRAQWARAGVHATAGRLTMEDLSAGTRSGTTRRTSARSTRSSGASRSSSGSPRPRPLFSPPSRALRTTSSGGRPQAGSGRCSRTRRTCATSSASIRDDSSRWPSARNRCSGCSTTTAAAAALKYAEADPGEVAKEFRRLREDTISLLRALPHEAWRKTGLHPEKGELTVEQLAARLADHDAGHLGKIRALRG